MAIFINIKRYKVMYTFILSTMCLLYCRCRQLPPNLFSHKTIYLYSGVIVIIYLDYMLIIVYFAIYLSLFLQMEHRSKEEIYPTDKYLSCQYKNSQDDDTTDTHRGRSERKDFKGRKIV